MPTLNNPLPFKEFKKLVKHVPSHENTSFIFTSSLSAACKNPLSHLNKRFFCFWSPPFLTADWPLIHPFVLRASTSFGFFLLPLFWLIIFNTYKKIVKRTPAPQPPSHLQQQQQTSSSLSSSRNSSSSSLRWPGNSTAAPCWLDLLLFFFFFFYFLFCVSFCDYSSSAAENGTNKNGLFFLSSTLYKP